MAIIAKRDNTLRLIALDEAAEALGLEIGLPLAAARAWVPQLVVVEADTAADQRLLAAIGEACRRYTPALSLDPLNGVHLDITGAAGLFGGEKALIADLLARMQRHGVSARIGAAPTLGLAWALAHYGGPEPLTSVRRLPVAALRLDAGSVGVLHRLGLRRVGQLLDLPRAALARRLGETLLERLDEILGFRSAAVDLVPEPQRFFAQHRLADPIASEDQVLRLCLWLAGQLAERLDRRRVGGRTFVLELFRVDGAVQRLVVKSGRPLRDPARITALFTERMAVLNQGLEADFGFDLLRLTAETVEGAASQTADFLGGADDGDLVALLDRLAVRLGPGAVHSFAPAPESHIPEQAVRSAPFNAKAVNAWPFEAPARYGEILFRPITLFEPPQPIFVIAGVPEDPPQQFIWRRATHRVVRAEGPERIDWEWWRGEEAKMEGEARVDEARIAAEKSGLMGARETVPDRNIRDYYRIEDDQGRRFWVFREGLYALNPQPRWFMHGLFP